MLPPGSFSPFGVRGARREPLDLMALSTDPAGGRSCTHVPAPPGPLEAPAALQSVISHSLTSQNLQLEWLGQQLSLGRAPRQMWPFLFCTYSGRMVRWLCKSTAPAESRKGRWCSGGRMFAMRHTCVPTPTQTSVLLRTSSVALGN